MLSSDDSLFMPAAEKKIDTALKAIEQAEEILRHYEERDIGARPGEDGTRNSA
jgi:hypothetical protein